MRDWGRPALDEWLCRRVLAGMAPKALAAASDGTISERTFYRWRRSLVRLESVEVGGYRTTYAIRRGYPPLRLGRWTKIGDKPVDEGLAARAIPPLETERPAT